MRACFNCKHFWHWVNPEEGICTLSGAYRRSRRVCEKWEQVPGAWVDVEDALPNPNQIIYCLINGSPSPPGIFEPDFHGARVFIDQFNGYVWPGGSLTHWMPIPKTDNRGEENFTQSAKDYQQSGLLDRRS